MSRPVWMDKAHEFQENCNDYSMCQCGVPLYYHDQWEQRQVLIDAVRPCPERYGSTHEQKEGVKFLRDCREASRGAAT